MADPVVAMDGHTYERRAIERIFAATPEGTSPVSPLTGQEIENRALVPNFCIRSQCQEYAEQQNSTNSDTES
eukprot:CAMPEP_0116857096 /NCGR_PEP_ID=MMETSP0418-20121206/20334_1 /TAXON_ID=1158023 /ORGANISM="Astrosyne radiata, Strain 13vi08-1A" /LENGTH=71 /DNA_ID=CAMNT_0004490683 /DNA_START=1 /DNA_END=216 /DNA_ORIENTATION=+